MKPTNRRFDLLRGLRPEDVEEQLLKAFPDAALSKDESKVPRWVAWTRLPIPNKEMEQLQGTESAYLRAAYRRLDWHAIPTGSCRINCDEGEQPFTGKVYNISKSAYDFPPVDPGRAVHPCFLHPKNDCFRNTGALYKEIGDKLFLNHG